MKKRFIMKRLCCLMMAGMLTVLSGAVYDLYGTVQYRKLRRKGLLFEQVRHSA